MIKGVTYILKNDAGVQAILGQNFAATKYKVYPVIAPQTEIFPYSVCRMSSRIVEAKNCGYTAEFIVSSYHQNYDDVADLDDAIVTALNGENGTHNGVTFGYITFLNSNDNYVEAYGGLYVRESTFKCSYGA